MHAPKKGVYPLKKKDGSVSCRASLTYRGKHISLGSFAREEEAREAYLEAKRILAEALPLSARPEDSPLPFEKWVSLVNFRDNGVYFANPIYLRPHFFRYYLEPEEFLLFDTEDLFYYSSHKISRRGGHLFVADYGSQLNLRARYGIRPFAVCGRDYVFRNGDDHDFRQNNIQIINPYYGVQRVTLGDKTVYRAKIHVRGDRLIGTYETELEAAIAYNKAIDLLRRAGSQRRYIPNEPDCSPREYSEIYVRLTLPEDLVSL